MLGKAVTKNLEAASLPDQSARQRAASGSTLCPVTQLLRGRQQLPPDGINIRLSTSSPLLSSRCSEKNPGVTAPGFTSDTREKHWSSQVQSFCSRTSGASNDTTGLFRQLLFAMHQYPRMGVSGFSFG